MDPFIGEIRIFSFTFPPKDWAMCDGQIMDIQQNACLFSIIGNKFGGDGRRTFALPNLEGRMPMHPGQGTDLTCREWGEQGGTKKVQLTLDHLPTHTHTIKTTGNESANTGVPSPKAYMGMGSGNKIYGKEQYPYKKMAQSFIGISGNSVPHENRQPFLYMRFCISLSGIYPPRS